jgi:hypothetical protein
VTLSLRWHDDVPGDLAAVRSHYGVEAFEEARSLITSLPGDPLVGDWLDRHDTTGDLSTCRKVKFGPDEVGEDGANLGPALRLVYRLVPSNRDAQKVEVLAVARRRDLEAYVLAADRLT